MLKKYPRPQFKREEWVNLNGKWQFEFDDANVGLKQGWWKGKKLSSEINVPYVFECAESGINDKTPHKYVWYARDLNVPKEWKGKRVFLNFGAVDYIAEVYVNGVLVKTHCGGNTAFSAEITDWVNYEKDRVYVRVIDDAYNELQPRGKQFWEDAFYGDMAERVYGMRGRKLHYRLRGLSRHRYGTGKIRSKRKRSLRRFAP